MSSTDYETLALPKKIELIKPDSTGAVLIRWGGNDYVMALVLSNGKPHGPNQAMYAAALSAFLHERPVIIGAAGTNNVSFVDVR